MCKTNNQILSILNQMDSKNLNQIPQGTAGFGNNRNQQASNSSNQNPIDASPSVGHSNSIVPGQSPAGSAFPMA